MTITIRSRHSYDKKNPGLKFKDKSLTQQQYLAESNIVQQIKKLSRTLDTTGQSVQEVVNQGAMYGDFSEIPDYRTYNQMVCNAKESFDNLDISIKQRFNNDPAAFFDFCLDENNRDEAVKLGIVNKQVDQVVDNLTTNTVETPQVSSAATADTPN